MARPAACSFAVPAQHERDRSLGSTRDPRHRPIIATVGQRIEKGDNEKRRTHARTHREKEGESRHLLHPRAILARVECVTHPLGVPGARRRQRWRRERMRDAMRDEMRRGEDRSSLRERPPLGRRGCERPSRDPSFSRSRARCKLRFSAVRLGRRIARGMMAATVAETGEGEGERRRSRTHMFVVCNRRARDVPSYHR